MTKEVLVTISGLQMVEESGKENVQIITAGNYYKKNNAHYIVYEEMTEGSSEPTKNLIKIREDKMDVTKRGSSNVHMVFERNKKNSTYYFTPFGSLLIGIDAKDILVEEEEQNIDIKVDYELEVNYEHLADCTILMNVKSKEDRSFTLS